VQVVIDSVSANHLGRPRPPKPTPVTILDQHLKARRLQVTFDRSGGLLDEWRRTCGSEFVSALIAHWESFNGVALVEESRALPQKVSKQLKAAGFTDTIDKLILRTVIKLDSRFVVSDDSDFWDPSDKASKGDSNAIIAKLCQRELLTTILLLDGLLRVLSRARG
jgi:hypothetical protein